MREKRYAILMIFMVFSVILLCSCSESGARVPERNPNGETTLEFRITEEVKDVDWSAYEEITGWFGAREYLGKGYEKTTDTEGTVRKPIHYVSYLITAYPDYADGGAFVTAITVTDPTVRVYGLTVNSTFEEFDAVFGDLGFELSDGDGAIPTRIAEKDGISVRLQQPTEEKADGVPTLHIRAEVTNREGIQY